MAAGMDVGEAISTTGNMGGFARALLLKQLMAGESEQSSRRKTAVKSATDSAFGVQENDGNLFLTDEAKKFYSPEESWVAIQNYPKMKAERAAKQLDTAQKAMTLVKGISDQVDSELKKWDDKGLSPEYISARKKQALMRLGEIYSEIYGNSAFAKYGIGEISAKMADLPLKDMNNEINMKIATDSLNEILSGKGTSFTHRDYHVAYGSLPPDTQKTLMPPDKLLDKYVPTDLLKMQQGINRQEEEMKAEVQLKKSKDLADYKPTELESKIRTIYEAYKGQISMEDAKAIATGTRKIVRDPYTEEWAMVDLATKEQIPLRPQRETSQVSPERESGINLYKEAEKGTGAWSAMMDYGSKISGLVRGPIAEEHIKSRQNLKMAQRSLFRALRESSKVLAFEMKTIFEEHPIDPSIWRSPEIARANFEVIDNFIRNRIAEQGMIANDKTMPVKSRKDAELLMRSMGDFINILGVPKKETEGPLTLDEKTLIKKYLPKE